jgi:hypothetical protein
MLIHIPTGILIHITGIGMQGWSRDRLAETENRTRPERSG